MGARRSTLVIFACLTPCGRRATLADPAGPKDDDSGWSSIPSLDVVEQPSPLLDRAAEHLVPVKYLVRLLRELAASAREATAD